MRYNGVRARTGGPLHRLVRWDEQRFLAWCWDPWRRDWVEDELLAAEVVYSGDYEPVAEEILEQAKAEVRGVADGSLLP